MTTAPVLRVQDLRVEYPDGGRRVTAVDGVSFELARGETLGLVGESGCGKSSLARTLLRLQPATAGRVEFDGADLAVLRPEPLRRLRRSMQYVFQDSAGSLNPRMQVRKLVAETLRAHDVPKAQHVELVERALTRVGLRPEVTDRYPHQLSGGQRQRVNIARALVIEPSLLVADEPVSALDVSVQSQVLNLLLDLKSEMQLTCMFVSHNLAVVAYLCDRIAVMYLGRIVEIGPTDELIRNPAHPYTRALLAAVPSVAARGRRELPIAGELPSNHEIPAGCRYRGRCPLAQETCAEVDPPLTPLPSGQVVACHFPQVDPAAVPARASEPAPAAVSLDES